MALSIKSEAADQLARELADLTGESITEAVTTALRERLESEHRARQHRRSALNLAAEFGRLAVLDHRSADDILGFDANGLPA